jgi:hypothetical protein
VKWNSARNYQLLDKEFTSGMEFRRELPAHGQGIHQWNGIPLGITSSWTRNSPVEWNSARNYQLLDKGFTSGMEFRWELPAPGQGIHQWNGIPQGITRSCMGNPLEIYGILLRITGSSMRNQQEECLSAGNFQLIGMDSYWQFLFDSIMRHNAMYNQCSVCATFIICDVLC